jgi:TolB protein
MWSITLMVQFLRRTRARVVLPILFAIACGDDATAPTLVVDRVAVTPEQRSLLVGESATFVATALNEDGEVIEGRSVQWTTSDASVATVNAVGVITAMRAGGAIIRATVDGETATAGITVAEPTVVKVELSPATLTLESGDIFPVFAVAKDALGRELPDRSVVWTSVDPSVATVDATGRVTAVRAGVASVIATIDDRSATLRVTVTSASVHEVIVLDAGAVLEVGETRQFVAEARDSRGNPVLGRPVQWTVSAPPARISPTGSFIGARPGVVSVRATIDGVMGAIDVRVVEAEPLAWDLLYHRPLPNGGAAIAILSPGTGLAPFTVNAGEVSSQPTPSPTGHRIAFYVSMRDYGTGPHISDIFAVDRNGLNMRQLTAMPGDEFDPAWSPTGDRIAFVHKDENGRHDIWVMNADGTAATNLTSDMPDGDGITRQRAAPAWSPDGTRLVFHLHESGDLPQPTLASIMIMNADGSDKRTITSSSTGFDMLPSWSPDGRTIAFLRYFAGGDGDIALVPVAGGAVTRLSRPGLQSMPVWSPDGTLIAYMQSDIGRDNIYTMRADGTDVRLRTVDPAWGGGLSPTWIRR